MRIRLPLLGLATLLAIAACATGAAARQAPRYEAVAVGAESIQIPLDDRAWKTVNSQASTNRAMFGWRIAEAPSTRWTEQIMVLGLGVSSRPWPSLPAIVSEAKAQALARCPEADWVVLRQEENAVTYQWSSRDCPKLDLQQQIVRIVESTSSRFRTSITHRFTLPSSEVRDRWIGWFEGIEIESR